MFVGRFPSVNSQCEQEVEWAVQGSRKAVVVPAQGAPGAVVPRCPGLRTAPALPPPAWLLAEICRCAGPCQVRNARSFPKTPLWEGSAICPALTSAWLEAVDEPGARPRPCHTCAGPVSPWQCPARQGAHQAVLGRCSHPQLPPSSRHRGALWPGLPWERPQQQHTSNSSCSHMLRVKPHAAVCA